MKGWIVTSFARDTSGRTYAGVTHNVWGATVMTSDDLVPGFGGLCAHSILVDERDPQRIWVGISAAGLFRSDDGGETFVSRNQGVDSDGEGWCVHCVVHDPLNADVIYRQDHRGVYRTSDGGDGWALRLHEQPGQERAHGNNQN
jgi:hypothetical protein